MKKVVYLIIFAVLGLLFAFLIHALIEIWYINLLLKDFSKYSLGFSWSQWYLIHHIISAILFIIGGVAGFWQGKFWWRKIYAR